MKPVLGQSLVIWGCEKVPGTSLKPSTVMTKLQERQQPVWQAWLNRGFYALLIVLATALLTWSGCAMLTVKGCSTDIDPEAIQARPETPEEVDVETTTGDQVAIHVLNAEGLPSPISSLDPAETVEYESATGHEILLQPTYEDHPDLDHWMRQAKLKLDPPISGNVNWYVDGKKVTTAGGNELPIWVRHGEKAFSARAVFNRDGEAMSVDSTLETPKAPYRVTCEECSDPSTFVAGKRSCCLKLMPQPPDHVNVEWELGEPWQELSEKSGMSIASVPSDIAKAAVKAKVRVGDEVIEIVDHVDIPDASFTINASMTSPQNPEENTTYSVAFSVNPPLPEGTDVNWTVDGMEQLERSGTMIKAIDFRGGQATVSAEFTFNDEPRTVNLSFPLELNPTIGNPKQSDVDGTLQSN